MHPAFLLPEILQEIFNYLDPEPDAPFARFEPVSYSTRQRRPSRNHTLTCLARTCKAFLDTALGELWASSDPGRLLQTLDNRLLIEGRKVLVRPSPRERWIVDLESFTESDWDAFHRHSHLVRELHLGAGVHVNSPALRVLASPPSNLKLTFPRLTRLCIDDFYPVLLPHWLLFMSPSLQSLDVRSYRHNTDALIPLLTSIPDLCPHLEHLVIRLRTYSDTAFIEDDYGHCRGSFIDVLSLIVPQLQSLKSLRVPDLTGTAMTDLPSRIKRLSLDSARNITTLSTIRLDDLCSLHLGSPESLDVAPLKIDELLSIIPCFSRCPPMISFTSALPFSPQASHQFFSLLPDPPECNLQALRMDPRGYTMERDGTVMLSNLQPLFRYTSLCTFIWYFSAPIALTDDDFLQLAAAWPNLEELTMIWPFSPSPESNLSYRGLFAFATACRHLRFLEVALDSERRGGVPLGSLDNGLPLSDTLESLKLDSQHVSLENVAAFSVVLALAFPRLRHVYLWALEGSRYLGHDIANALDGLRAMRRSGEMFSLTTEKLKERVAMFFVRD
ncbi:hypothetical protein CONPUDRAFT_160982 [Coniophora puteana RWD-64-598 SS2]|uniref:F-box domain-containing protein n=1 Tax=Coniophora puteana (strain RWD-64-598) TaxID=741705 RepID=A0A5M3N4C4_CONPW|nr:uncharacterized protein CONPUDRAFT_160982 [Coniophora puteana RWD-64-598 SS2]EIW86158.1 hypothetical protein CONPUDRAFT_160982 [Coniophora puteana RWD-64-598 SS2]